MFIDYIDTPLGLIEFQATDKGISQVIFCGSAKANNADSNPKTINANELTELCKQQLSDYFAGTIKSFNLPLDPKGTAFQKSVWRCLSQIPFGEVYTYLDIAKMVDKPKGSQAVGGANGRNPISIIIPCHRVIGSNGSLTGYAGGLERKLWLLNHEGITIKNSEKTQQLNIKNVIHSRQAKTEFLS